MFTSKKKLLKNVSDLISKMERDSSPALQKEYHKALDKLISHCKSKSIGLYGFKPNLATDDEIYGFEVKAARILELRVEADKLQKEIEGKVKWINSRRS